MSYRNCLIIIFIYPLLAFAQYPPAAGEPGSTAIHKDSSVFKGWASQCTVVRGPMDISHIENGYASYGQQENAIGKAGENGYVSFGDGGTAIVSFLAPVGNGPGPDFAIFENGFKAIEYPFDYFLELAFVEVSTDGQKYVRFPSASLTQTDSQLTTFGQLKPEQIHNLAGKYIINYGVPFDLEELKDSSGINPDSINYIRIKDVIGNISGDYTSYDSYGHKINDPWPTPFNTGGFDLEAVGVIYFNGNTGYNLSQNNKPEIYIYPNPLPVDYPLNIAYKAQNFIYSASYEIFDFAGQKIIFGKIDNHLTKLELTGFKKGLYVIRFLYENTVILKSFVIE
ncbi:MAG: T9SS type A sorting domain-containing protein [Bacteroidia bacterium]|nr:T9SS type A sorting domain-containing protein [Bacteroidia bacterium]